MASTNNPRGFVEHRHLGNGVPVTRRYRVKENGNPHQIYKGDPVVLVSGNTVTRLGTLATAAQVPVLGIARAVYDSNEKPFTHSQPSRGPYLPASTAGFVDVNIDPLQTYLVNTDATVVSTMIGQYVEHTAGTPNTAAGISGMHIETSGASNTAAASLPFQVISLGDDNWDGFVGGEANQDVEVVLATQAFRNSNKVR